MNKEQYNNIIKASLNEDNLQCENNLEAVRTVFNNMGVALPQGDFSKVSETLATDDYMYWAKCTQEEAQAYANQGIPAIRIDETNIQLISAEENDDSVEGVATTSSVLFNNNDLVIEELEPISKEPTYYAYSRSSTSNTGSSQFIPNGTYYMNSAFTGQYLQNNSNQADNTSGLLANLGNTIKWKIEKTGSYYTIRYAADTTKYLGVASVDPDSAIVNIYTINSSTVPNYCKWTPAKGTDSVGGVVFKNLFNSRYLACAASILTRPSLGADPSIPYLQCTWRIIETSKYGNGDSFQYKELNDFDLGFTGMFVGDVITPDFVKSPSRACWSSPRDFALTSSNSEYASIGERSTIIVHRAGAVSITAKHKVTGRTKTFNLIIEIPPVNGNYGAVIYNGRKYQIALPTNSNDFSSWEKADEDYAGEDIRRDFSIYKFFAGYEADDLGGVANGENVSNLRKDQMKYASIFGLVLGLPNAIQSAYDVSAIRYRFKFYKKYNHYIVTVELGSNDVQDFYDQYASGVSHYFAKSAGVLTTDFVRRSSAVAQYYEYLTGEDLSALNDYDLVMTVDAKHKTDTYHSYIWVNSEGKLMEKPIVHEGDSAVIGRLYGFLWSNFEPMLELPLNGSVPAHELFQELFEPSLNS